MTGRVNEATGRTPVRALLAVTFAALLLGVVYASGEWGHVIATTAGFATAIALIGGGVVGWERQVVTAQSAGLVERSS